MLQSGKVKGNNVGLYQQAGGMAEGKGGGVLVNNMVIFK